ncbi:16687_t:CDS:2, partial [Racocetra persica]
PTPQDLEDSDDESLSDLEPEVVLNTQSASEHREIDYEAIRNKIDNYRENIEPNKRLYNPLWYYIIDHSGQHTPTNNLLSEFREIIPKDVSFIVEETSEELSKLFNNLVNTQDLNSVLVKNEKEDNIKDVWKQIHKNLGRPKRKLSEAMHKYRNILPYFDNIFDDDEWQLECGENSLVSSSERRNLNRDPQSQARIGQKCDITITSNKLGWSPELLIGEVSGGILPQCSAHKAWEDKIKLGIGLRDILVRLENELPGINQAVYGVQVVGYKLKVYAM